jgi:hypothetical protein
MSAAGSRTLSRAEAERQLAASAERHREAAASLLEVGRPEAGQHVAVKSVGRAVHLVSFALKRAAEADVPFERLVELTGWEPDLVREGLQQEVPAPQFVARLAPATPDARAVAEAAATFAAITRLRRFTERLLADLDGDAHAWSPPPPADLDDLHNRLAAAWRSWSDELGRRGT